MSNNQSLPSPDLIEGALLMAEALSEAHVAYALIGGLAAGKRTDPRFTRDIDFLVNVPQLKLPSVLEELSRRGFEFELTEVIREWTQHHMTTLSFRGIRVDWLKPVIPAYQHVLDTANDESLGERPIRVANAEGLILLKLLAFRTRDQLDIELLVAAHGDKLDMEWIRSEWQSVHSLDDSRMKWLETLVQG